MLGLTGVTLSVFMVDRTRLDQWLADHNAKLIRRDADTRGEFSNKWDVYAIRGGRLMVVWSCFDNRRNELDNIDVFLPATEENSWDATIAALDRFANETNYEAGAGYPPTAF
jgi:hypothetical protein